ELERFEDAEEQFLEAWRRIEDDPAAPAESLSRYASDISRFYAAWGETEEAAAWQELAGR
ncbi:MAG: hypothetical protein AAGB93_07065, partial [Planctomycetota bacterium]